jgi:hypothetical protein
LLSYLLDQKVVLCSVVVVTGKELVQLRQGLGWSWLAGLLLAAVSTSAPFHATSRKRKEEQKK